MELGEPASQIRVGYGKQLEDYNPNEKFFIKMPALRYAPKTAFLEAQEAAKSVYQELAEKPLLCLSGGLDSEAMAMAFLAAAVPFEVITLRFEKALNFAEIRHAESFCREFGIKQQFVDLDVVDFFEQKKYESYLDKYYSHSLEVCAQLWFLDQIKRPFVWAGEAFRLFVKNGQPEVQAVSELEAVVYRFIKYKKLKAIPNFHFYSSELAWAFFSESLHTRGLVYEDDHDPAHYIEKLNFYRACGFDIREIPERKHKLHGFEMVKNYFDFKLAPQGLSYNEIYRLPFMERYPITKKAYIDILKSDEIALGIIS